jgi:Mg2+ and Co2+ transporter CorA
VLLQARDLELERLRAQLKNSEQHAAVVLAELGASTRALSDMRHQMTQRDAELGEIEDLRSTVAGMRREAESARRSMSRLEEERLRCDSVFGCLNPFMRT